MGPKTINYIVFSTVFFFQPKRYHIFSLSSYIRKFTTYNHNNMIDVLLQCAKMNT